MLSVPLCLWSRYVFSCVLRDLGYPHDIMCSLSVLEIAVGHVAVIKPGFHLRVNFFWEKMRKRGETESFFYYQDSESLLIDGGDFILPSPTDSFTFPYPGRSYQ